MPTAVSLCPCGHKLEDHEEAHGSSFCEFGCTWRDCEGPNAPPCQGHECDCPDHRESRFEAMLERGDCECMDCRLEKYGTC